MIYLVGLIFILQFTSLIYEKGDFPPHVSSVTITGPPLLLSWFEYHTMIAYVCALLLSKLYNYVLFSITHGSVLIYNQKVKARSLQILAGSFGPRPRLIFVLRTRNVLQGRQRVPSGPR